jgi:hypothetical protein
MGLFERFIEGKNIKPIGEIKERAMPEKGEQIDWFILIFGQVFFWVIMYFMIEYCLKQEDQIAYFVSILPLFFTYCWVGSSLDIKPRYDNMGFGGFLDNPFRYSDDMNRGLFFFKAILSPAMLMGLSWVQLVRLVKKLVK